MPDSSFLEVSCFGIHNNYQPAHAIIKTAEKCHMHGDCYESNKLHGDTPAADALIFYHEK